MLRLSQVLFFLFFAIVASAQRDTLFLDEDYEITHRPDYSYYRFLEHRDSLYFVEDYFPNHVLQARCSYADFALTDLMGYFIEYDSLGEKIVEGPFTHNKKNGWFVAYNRLCQNDYVDDSVFYIDGLSEGPAISRDHTTHKLITFGNYKNDKVTGRWPVLYPSGDTQIIQYFEDGLRMGPYTYFEDGTGTVVFEVTMYRDVTVGKVYGFMSTTYGRDTANILTNLDSTASAVYIEVFDSVTHRRKREGLNVHEKLEGVWTYYCNDTSLIYSRYTYLHGTLEGPYSLYTCYNGKLSKKGEYKNDQLHGHYYSYYYDGDLMEDGFYKNGQRTGLWTKYNSKGEIDHTHEYLRRSRYRDTYYHDGKPVSSHISSPGKSQTKCPQIPSH